MRTFLAVFFYSIFVVNFDFFIAQSFGSAFNHGLSLICAVLIACLLTKKGLPCKISHTKCLILVVIFFVLFKICQVFIQGNFLVHWQAPNYWMLFFSLALVSVGEELFFRGVLFDDVKAKYNTKLAILVSMVLFILIHAFDTSVLNLMTFSLISAAVFTYLRVKFKSVTAPILAHFVGNSSVFLFLHGI